MQEILYNTKVSWKAKGLYCAMVNKSKEGKLSKKEIIKISKGGNTLISNGLKELIKLGYLEKKTFRNRGKFINCVWILKNGHEELHQDNN